MRVVTHNVWVGQKPVDLRTNLRKLVTATLTKAGPPAAIALQEAHRLDKNIPGYERYWVPGSEDDQNNQLLIHKDVEVIRQHHVHAPYPWIGPKHGERHDPRQSPGVLIENEEGRWNILSTHLVPNEQRNPEAAAGEWDSLTVWVNGRREDRPLVLLADWNHRKDSKALLKFAHRTNTDIHLKGVDGALTRNCGVRKIEELGKKFGSDAHNPVVLDLVPDVRSKR